MNTIFKSFLTGLNDYTVNERGDVGSWARLACIKGLCLILESLIGEARDLPSPSKSEWSTTFPSFSRYLCPDTYHTAIGGILKQGVERLDNVRQSVGELFPLLLDLPQPAIEHGEEWTVQGKTLFVSLLRTVDTPGWNDGSWLYPRAVRFLDVEMYRMPVLRGLILSIASKTSSTVRNHHMVLFISLTIRGSSNVLRHQRFLYMLVHFL